MKRRGGRLEILLGLVSAPLRRTQRKYPGFTLIELIVVIFIIGILVTITGATYLASLKHSRDNQRIQNLLQVRGALEQYYADFHSYPLIQSNPHSLFLAKWQLEKVGGPDCVYANPAKQFLVPHYLSSIPEDPSYKMNIQSGCTDQNFGQYLYTVTGNNTTPQNFYLMARLERVSSMSLSAPTPAALIPFTTEFTPGNSSGITLCNRDTFNQACTQNYFVSHSQK